MLLRADHRAIEDAGIGDSAAPVAAAPAGNDHAVQGTIAPPAPAAAIAPKQAAVAPPPRTGACCAGRHRARRRGACRAGSQRQTAAGDEAERAAAEGQRRDRRCAGFDPAFAAAGRQTRAAGRTGTCPAQVTQRAPRKRDGLERHVAAAPPQRNPKRRRRPRSSGIGEARPVVAAAVDVIGVVDAGEHRFVPAGQFVIGCESGCRRDDRATGQAVEQFQVDGACASGRKPDRDQVTANAFGIKGPRMPTKACGAKRDKLLCRRSDARYAATARPAAALRQPVQRPDGSGGRTRRAMPSRLHRPRSRSA